MRSLTPDATESLSVAFDADLSCIRETFRWKLKGGDLKVKCCYSDNRNLLAVLEAGGLTP